MRLDDALADGEPETAAGGPRARFAPGVLAEQVRQLLGGDAAALVGDRQLDVAAVERGRPAPDPVVTIAAGGAVTEGSAAGFTLTADPAPAADLAGTVAVSQSGDVADASALGERTVTIPGGSTSADFTVATVDDDADEEDGQIVAALSAGDGYTLGDAARATVAVADDDEAKPAILTDRAIAREGDDDAVVFNVRLDGAASHTVTVDYATADGAGVWAGTGTATAGVDYTATSGTLTFAAGETSKSVSVLIIDDVIDEGSEYFLLRFSNPQGATLDDSEVEGLIRNTDLIPGALLARFGRATAEQVVTQIEERMAAPRRRGFRARFAGRELRSGQEGDFALGFLTQLAQPMGMGSHAGAASRGMGPAGGAPMGMGPHAGGAGALGVSTGGMNGMGAAGGSMGMSSMGGMPGAMGGYGPAGGAHGGRRFDSMGMGGDLFSNSEFELNRESRGGMLSVWSRSSRSYFSGLDDALSLDGDVRTTMFGADYSRGALTVGLSVGRTLGLGGYRRDASAGRMTTSMTGFYPWVGYQVNERVSVWGVTGYGTGALSLTPDGRSAMETGVSMAMSAVGTRGELIGARATGGFALAFKADALWVDAASDLVDGAMGRLNASDAGVTRVRTALEGSRGFALGRLSLTPSVEVGLRRDGGDAETGAGMDVGGGLAFTDAVTGLSLDVRVRTLVVTSGRGVHRARDIAVVRVGPDPVEPAGPDGAGGPVVGRFRTGRGRGAVEQPDGLRHGLAPDARGRRAAQRGGGLRAAGGRAVRGDAARRVDDLAVRPGLPRRLRPRGARPGRRELRAGRRRAAAGEPDGRRDQQRCHGPGNAGLVETPGTWRFWHVAKRFDEQEDNEMPDRERLRSDVNELPSAGLTTKFLAVCEQYGSERLAVRIVIAGRSAGVPGLPEDDNWMAWNAGEIRAAVELLQRKRGV